MYRSLVYLTLSICAAHAWHSTCQAQLVRVAPGYVKAPFVRVYSYPDGSSYVRAPFVGIYSPGYRKGHRVAAGPSRQELAAMDWQALGQVIRASAAQLDIDLNEVSSGAEWRSRLKIAEITAHVPPESNLPPADGVRQQLQETATAYARLDSSPESKSVSNLRSFQVLQQALAEYVTPPAQRLRRQVHSSAGQLNRALERFATGGSWQNYLMLSEGLAISSEDNRTAANLDSAVDYQQILTRFDSVVANTDYHMISDLPEFQTTRSRLADYLGMPETTPPQKPEELPVPDPSATRSAVEL